MLEKRYRSNCYLVSITGVETVPGFLRPDSIMAKLAKRVTMAKATDGKVVPESFFSGSHSKGLGR